MSTFKKITSKIAWLLLYLAFNACLFFVEISVLFNKPKMAKSNTGFDILDVFLDLGGVFLDILSAFAMLAHLVSVAIIAIMALLFFIPVQRKYIKPKYEAGSKKKFFNSLVMAIAVLMVLKLIQYAWMFIEMNYV